MVCPYTLWICPCADPLAKGNKQRLPHRVMQALAFPCNCPTHSVHDISVKVKHAVDLAVLKLSRAYHSSPASPNRRTKSESVVTHHVLLCDVAF